MDFDTFIDNIADYPLFEWCIPEGEEGKTLIIKNTEFGTELVLELQKEPWKQFKTFEEFIRFSWCGKNIEHVTRVTGYFSKVRGWNPGKQGELKDRRHQQL